MEFKEFSAKNLEDAKTKACEEYTVPLDRLEVEVIEEGSVGFLGIGAKPAVIRARVKEETKAEEVKAAPVKSEKKSDRRSERSGRNFEKKNPEKKEVREVKEFTEEKAEEAVNEVISEKKEKRLPVNVDEAKVKADAEKFLKDVFEAMGINVELKIEYYSQDAELLVELSGDEMGVLIGKRGQTLDSLQYLTSLVINKEVNGYIRVKVDTEDYRKRRRETLENLAKSKAFKVGKSRRSFSFEPMNPYERRIIHSVLQGNKYVNTHSEGDEPFRRVVITPKRDR